MRQVYFFTFLFFIHTLSAQNTTIKFEVLLDGDSIGTISAIKSISGKKVVNNISNNTDTKVFLLNIHVESEVYATFENDILTGSFAYRHVSRGSENIETTVKYVPVNRYKVMKNGKERMFENSGIKFTVVDLYFKEPKGLNTLFSNTHGDFVPVRNSQPGYYDIFLPDGKTNTFIYQSGKLVRVEVPTAVGNVVFNRK